MKLDLIDRKLATYKIYFLCTTHHNKNYKKKFSYRHILPQKSYTNLVKT